MAKIKKAQTGTKASSDNTRVKKASIDDRPSPSYNKLGKASSKDSSMYREGFYKGLSNIKKNIPKSETMYNRNLIGVTSERLGYDEAYSKDKKQKLGGVTKAKDGKWIQKATASIKRRGTKGVCTGSKFGGPTCKPGSKRYNLAKVFKSMAKKKKK